MPHHHAQHTQNVGPILFTCNENIAHAMPRVTTCAVMSCTHRVACAHAGKPSTLIIHGAPGITYGCAIHTGQMIFIKINCLTF